MAFIPLHLKQECVRRHNAGEKHRDIYSFFSEYCAESSMSYKSFDRLLYRWNEKYFGKLSTESLERATYENFAVHDVTLQVGPDGKIRQGWYKQKPVENDPDYFISCLSQKVEKYEKKVSTDNKTEKMLEISLYDMHWGINTFDNYSGVLDSILEIIRRNSYEEVVFICGQDFFHNDSIVKGETSKGTKIEKVDMKSAIPEAQKFVYSIIDTALDSGSKVKVIYSPGNHDISISWMFMMVLAERYGTDIVDTSMEYRKCITYGNNAVMITHGNSKIASSANNLAQIFATSFPNEFANAKTREVHAGHTHHEKEIDCFGVMVRRLSTGGKIDEWTDYNDYVGSNRRFMLFEWTKNALSSIIYVGGDSR